MSDSVVWKGLKLLGLAGASAVTLMAAGEAGKDFVDAVKPKPQTESKIDLATITEDVMVEMEG
jgi:hypothetical protein